MVHLDSVVPATKILHDHDLDTMESLRVAVLADTHAPRRWKTCPAGVARHLRRADLILHATAAASPGAPSACCTSKTLTWSRRK